MKRALIACALALTTPAFAQPPSDTGGPTGTQAQRDETAVRVRAGASCAECDLFQIDLAYRNVSGRDFSGARIRQADLSVAIADRTRFVRANASLTNFFGARLTRADFTEANLAGTTFVGAYLGSANFTGARLDGANFSGAEMASSQGLTQAQLNTACGDATTQLPPGLTLPTC